jgi:hypothetical protein
MRITFGTNERGCELTSNPAGVARCRRTASARSRPEIGGFAGCSGGAPQQPAQPVCDWPKAHIFSRIGPVFTHLFHINNVVDTTKRLSHFDTALYQNSSMNKKT